VTIRREVRLSLLSSVMTGAVLGCGTEPVGDVSGDYLLAAQYSGALSECSLTGAQLRLAASANKSLSGSLEGGEVTCESSDPVATPFIPRPAEVRGAEQDGDLVFSLWPPDGTSLCSLFVFTIRTGGNDLSGSLHSVQQFCQGLPNERVTGSWEARAQLR
jgi:hypothetical protein